MKKKGILFGALALVLVAAVSMGSTFALLKAQTEPKQNVFTAAAGLTGAIKETAFDGVGYGEARPNEITDPALGYVKAQKVVPGRVIPKDPMVKNTSDATRGVVAWIAVKLDVVCGDAQTSAEAMEALREFATIDFNTTDWQAGDDGVTFYYKVPVAPQGETTALFNSVTINEDVAVTEIAERFEINATAYLIQAEGAEGATDLATAITTFAATFPTSFAA